MDIVAISATGTSQQVDGLLIPRVERQRAAAMNNVPTSTLIYVNEVATGSQTSTTQDVDSVGYYFFNGTKWQKLNPSSVAQADDWHLTGNTGTTNVSSVLNATITAGNYVGTADDRILSFGVDKKLIGQMFNDGSFIGGGNASGSSSSPLKAKFSWGDANNIGSLATGASMILGSGNTINATDFNLALGRSNTIAGVAGYAVGQNNDIYNASAYGYSNVVSGISSLALGNGNRIGPYSVGATKSKFYYNFVYGDSNTIEDNTDTYYNVLIGRGNGLETGGMNNAILGSSNRIRANSSVSGGYDDNLFLSNNATIVGNRNSGLGQGLSVMGANNLALSSDKLTLVGKNSLFIGTGRLGSSQYQVNGVYAIGDNVKTLDSNIGEKQYIFGRGLGVSTYTNTMAIGVSALSDDLTLAAEVDNSSFYFGGNHIFRTNGASTTKTRLFVNASKAVVEAEKSVSDIVVPQGIRYMPVSSPPSCSADNLGLVILNSATANNDKLQVCLRTAGNFGWRDL